MLPSPPGLAGGPLAVVVVADWFIDGVHESHGGAAVGQTGAAAAAVAVAVSASVSVSVSVSVLVAAVVLVAVPKLFNEPSGAWEVDEGALTRGCCRFCGCCVTLGTRSWLAGDGRHGFKMQART